MTTESTEYRIGQARILTASRELILDGEPVKLGARAFDLLVTLVQRRDRVVGKSELLDLVWPGLVVEENNLQVQVLALRRLLGQHSIATIPGRGYRWVAAVETPYRQSEGGRPAAVRPAASATVVAARSGVPALSIQLIGREADLDALGPLMSAHRLVTIVGPGGIGKTRIAQAMAAAHASKLRDGAIWVDLAAQNDPAMVPAAMATAAGSALGPSNAPVDALIEALRSRSILLVLDNAEHLVDATARAVQQLLQATADVRFLVTSQLPLRVAAEQVYRLGALQLPDAGSTAPQAARSSAVALFLERAHASARTAQFSDSDVLRVAEVCRQLDALPLAIESAAARTAQLGLPALLANLDQRLRLLGSGDRTAPERQQTLRAAFNWSHELMAPETQVVFRRLGVFAGSFTLDAAREVVSDQAINPWSVVEHLAELIDRSMVAVEDRDEPRYRLLESGRAFALDRLQAAGEFELLHDRHADAMAQLAARCFEDFWMLGDAELLGRYVPDLDNLRAAARRTGADRPDVYARLASGSMLLLRRLSLIREAAAMARSAEALAADAISPAEQARLWLSIAFNSYRRDASTRAIDLYRRLGDQWGVYLSLYPFVHQFDPTPDDLESASGEAQRLRQPGWPAKMLAIGAGTEAWAAFRAGELAAALRLLQEGVRLCDAAGADDLGTAFRMQQHGVTFLSGDRDGASVLAEATVERCHRLQNAYRLTCTQAFIVNLRLAQDAPDRARAVASEFAAYDRVLGWPHVREIADALALLAALEGRVEDAARLSGFADRAHADSGSESRDVASECSRKRAKLLAASCLDAGRIAELEREGARLDIDRAVALALVT